MEEEFVDIKGYEGLYQINRLGVVKSLERHREDGAFLKQRILKKCIDGNDYMYYGLHKNNKKVNKKIHILLFTTFVNEYNKLYYQIDHIDRNKQNNNLNNLRLVSKRNNQNNRTDESIYGIGVTKRSNKYISTIGINKKNIHLGYFSTPQQAHSKYLEVKQQIEEIEKITRSYSFTKTKINGEYFLDFFPI